MKKYLILSAFICSGIFLNAQNFSLSAKSGDVELDASLNDINVKAKTDINVFKKDLSIEFNIGVPKIEQMLSVQMSPADIYMVAEVANFTKKEPEAVEACFNKNKDKGWGVIAKEMGIKPGSPEFHALKGKAKNKKEKGNHGGGNGHGKGHGKNK
ncbi:MAG: hypothetical protein ABIP51_14830 [Bacteroidia bacterium]